VLDRARLALAQARLAPRGRIDARFAAVQLRGAHAYVNRCGFGAWRSLVAHLPWEQGVGRSNRLAPIAPVAQVERAAAF
jgi:hypothetical protein